ncbi:MAG: glyoxalase [Lachnospira sp.]
MEKHIDECAKVFLRDQKKLFDEPVAYDLEEAKEFLEDCFASYCKDIKELRELMDEEGMDVSELSDKELEEQLEVFKLDNGGYFFVEA